MKKQVGTYALIASVWAACVPVHAADDWKKNDVTATAHGAIPDDAVDDTDEIQSAIDAAASSGGPVFIPEGEYKVSKRSGKSYALHVPDDVRIVGAGKGSHIKLDNLSGQAAHVFAVDDDAVNVVFENFHIDGNLAGHSSLPSGNLGCSGITLPGSSNVIIDKMWIMDCVTDSLFLGKGTDEDLCRRVRVTNSHLTGSGRSAVFVASAEDCYFGHNFLRYCA